MQNPRCLSPRSRPPGVGCPASRADPRPRAHLGLRAGVPRTPQREYAVERLAESVRIQWEDEEKIRGLADPDPMPVRWTCTGHDVSDHLHHIFDGEPGLRGAATGSTT
jgi:hypothetical protein